MDELDCVIGSKLRTNMILYGNPSTGKTYHAKRVLLKYKRDHILIDCSNIVDFKLLLNKIYYLTTNEVKKFETVQGLIDALNEKLIEMVLLLKNLQMVPTTNLNFDLFKLFNNLPIAQMSILFIISNTTIPCGLITSNILKVYFKKKTQQELISILIEKESIPPSTIARNYIKLIVDTYYPYTTDLRELEDIVVKNWPSFVTPLKSYPESGFMDLYKSFKTELSDRLITKSLIKSTGDRRDNDAFSALTCILIVSSYLASYNDPRFDFTLFSKLKEIRSGKRTFARRVRNGNVKKIVINMKWFEFERMISILKSIYKDTEYYSDPSKELNINLATYVEFNNLLSLKMLVRNEKKYKINCHFDFVRKCCSQLGFNIENYLAE